MARALDKATLENAARDYAGALNLPTVYSRTNPERAIGGRGWVIQNLYDFYFKDSFDFVLDVFKQYLGPKALAEFEAETADLFTPRDDGVFANLLAEHLALDPDGNHIEGKIGKTVVGSRPLGQHMIEVEPLWSIQYRKSRAARGLSVPDRVTEQKIANWYWPVYAGEEDERAAARIKEVIGADAPGADPLPSGADMALFTMAFNTRISNECAILACDAVVDNLDEGTGASIAGGRTGAQPADPDTAPTGTLLFTLVYSATAFGAAVDNTGAARATAAAITDDTSADATGTLGYVRNSSSNDGATALDDHIDGEAGTATADWIFNTLSIVAGATVTATSHTVDMPES